MEMFVVSNTEYSYCISRSKLYICTYLASIYS